MVRSTAEAVRRASADRPALRWILCTLVRWQLALRSRLGGRSGVLFLFALPVATEEAGSELAFRKHLLNAESRDANTNFHFFQSLDRPHVKHLHVTAVT